MRRVRICTTVFALLGIGSPLMSQHSPPLPDEPGPRNLHQDLPELTESLCQLEIFSRVPGDPNGWGLARVGLGDSDSLHSTLVFHASCEYRATAAIGMTYEEWTKAVNPVSAAALTADNTYFYPASTVKLFAAIAAAEKIEELSAEDPRIDLHTPLRIHPLFADEDVADRDESNLDGGFITVGHEIRKLFLVSDNRAFNRLYGFVGHAELDRRIRAWGLDHVRIVHRLSEARTLDENRSAPRIELIDRESGAVIKRLPERHDPPTVTSNASMAGLRVGQRHIAGGTAVDAPFDFTDKNAVSLSELMHTLHLLGNPEFMGSRMAGFGAETRAFLLKAATQLPSESANPVYDPAAYPDDYAKFLLPGLLRVAPLDQWAITNKIGLAYGYVTENARVEHRPTGRAVYLAMTIYRNPNGTVNDGEYDYETTLGMFADVGERVGAWLIRD